MTTFEARFSTLTTAHLTDGCIHAQPDVRCAPAGTHSAIPGGRIAGRVLPARHAGSVDIFLEAITTAESGDVLVVDNGGRRDESCVGDLVAAEAGLGGVVTWGLHRDTADLREIGLPVFSLGSIPTGPLHPTPRHPDALTSATVGEWTVNTGDLVFGDEDGVVFVSAAEAEKVFQDAESVRDTERRQAARIRSGTSLREQVGFADFLRRREEDASYTFRQHLRTVGGAVEE